MLGFSRKGKSAGSATRKVFAALFCTALFVEKDVE
jgi:hypothetical protein